MALATAEAIRDRVYALVEALVPVSLTGDRFRRFRNEAGADFAEWAEKNSTAAFRRFQVREVGDDELPETSSVLEERVRTRFSLRVAYPQTHRYGSGNALDRDDVMNQDWLKINATVGIYGGANFSGAHDCILLGARKSRDSDGKIDYLVIEIDVEYLRSTT